MISRPIREIQELLFWKVFWIDSPRQFIYYFSHMVSNTKLHNLELELYTKYSSIFCKWPISVYFPYPNLIDLACYKEDLEFYTMVQVVLTESLGLWESHHIVCVVPEKGVFVLDFPRLLEVKSLTDHNFHKIDFPEVFQELPEIQTLYVQGVLNE